MDHSKVLKGSFPDVHSLLGKEYLLVSIQILSLGSGSWPTSGLGCEKPDQNYIQVATTGYKLVLAYDGEEYQIHTSEDGVISVDCTPEKSELDG